MFIRRNGFFHQFDLFWCLVTNGGLVRTYFICTCSIIKTKVFCVSHISRWWVHNYKWYKTKIKMILEGSPKRKSGLKSCIYCLNLHSYCAGYTSIDAHNFHIPFTFSIHAHTSHFEDSKQFCRDRYYHRLLTRVISIHGKGLGVAVR